MTRAEEFSKSPLTSCGCDGEREHATHASIGTVSPENRVKKNAASFKFPQVTLQDHCRSLFPNIDLVVSRSCCLLTSPDTERVGRRGRRRKEKGVGQLNNFSDLEIVLTYHSPHKYTFLS